MRQAIGFDSNGFYYNAIAGHAGQDRAETVKALLVRPFVWIKEAFAATQKKQRLSQELYGMSDYELSDIGLSRSEIPAVIDGSYKDQR